MSGELSARSLSGGLSLSGGGGRVARRERAELARQVSGVHSEAVVRSACLEAEAVLGRQKVSAAVALARAAQSEVAMMSGLEVSLAKTVPYAAPRLQMLGDIATAGVAGLLADAFSSLGGI